MTVHPLRTWIFGGFCLLLVLVVFTYQSITPSDGARIDKGQEAWTSRGILLRSYSQINGLQDNDLLVAIEGEPVVSLVERLFEPGVEPLEWTMGRTVLYQVSRNGEILDIPIRLGRQPLAEILSAHWGVLLYAGVTQLLGTFVFLRRPKDPSAASAFIWGMTSSHFYVWSLYRQVPDILNGYGFLLYSVIASFLWISNWAAGVQLALTFPRPLPAVLKQPRWIYFPYLAAYIFYLAFLVFSRVYTNNKLEWINAWGPGESLAAILMFLPMVYIFLYQYRLDRSEASRKKIRLVVFSALSLSSLTVLFYLLPPFFALPSLDANFLGLLLLLIPASMAVAILRYQLFDIDLIIRRTLIYSSLTFSLVFIYFASVIFFQRAFISVSGQSVDSQAAIVLSTLVIAALFNPFRRRIQEFIDRHFYRRRYDTVHTLEGFTAVLREEVDMDRLSSHLLSVVEETVQPETVSLWLINKDRGDN
jgi:hypothetical protein